MWLTLRCVRVSVSFSHYRHIYSVSMFLVFVKVDSNKLRLVNMQPKFSL